MLPKIFVVCRENIQFTNLFSFHFLHHVKHMQSVTLWNPDNFIQWSVNSKNFRKRLFSQIGNLVGHDWWSIKILTTEKDCANQNFACYWMQMKCTSYSNIQILIKPYVAANVCLCIYKNSPLFTFQIFPLEIIHLLFCFCYFFM